MKNLKKYVFSSIVLLLGILICFAPPLNGRVRLLWDYPYQEITNVTFNVYYSTNLQVPVPNWILLTNVSDTNISFNINPGQYFFFVTASNFWGESLPSNTVGTPAPPSNDANNTLQIEKINQ